MDIDEHRQWPADLIREGLPSLAERFPVQELAELLERTAAQMREADDGAPSDGTG